MSRPSAPSMPTPKQVRDLSAIMTELNPDARIQRIGPDGVTYIYGDQIEVQQWSNEPFSGEDKGE